VGSVADSEAGMNEVNFLAKVLSSGELRTFERDGDEDEEGKVINVEAADETGTVRLACWDGDAVAVSEGQLDDGDILRINGRPKEGYNGLEVSVDRAEVDEDAEIDVDPGGEARIETLTLGQSDVTLTGLVLGTDDPRTFDRDDGSEGQVRNIRVQDRTGDIRVALWGDKADIDLGPGAEVLCADVEIQEGGPDDLEASAGWQSAVVVIDDSEPDRGGESAGLGEFADGSRPDRSVDDADDGDSESASANGAGGRTETESGTQSEPVAETFTGTVVQPGDPVIIDTGEETLHVATNADVHLGQEVTVRGRHDGDTFVADDVF
jgi:replication factor A1